MNKKGVFLGLLFFYFLSQPAWPQFYKVYGYKTPEKNETEVVLWNTYIAQSNLSSSFFGEAVNRKGLWAHSFEIEYGVTDRLTVALYVDFEDPPGKSLKYYRTRAVFFRYRFAEKGKYFFDPAVYVEYYIPRRSYMDDEELEIRFILEKDIGNFRIDLNPMFEKKMSGSEIDEGLEFNYAVGLTFIKFQTVQPGIEFHGKMGELSGLNPAGEQRHVVFPTLDFRFGHGLHWHMGAGFGLTDSTDGFIIKSIFSYEF
ncbi:MAG: hypothetical protein JXB26_08230 [Candidatus Aminicenantes bacterium]|nr:hypothetical protein [Candidatus Aminicenantes bacterium]